MTATTSSPSSGSSTMRSPELRNYLAVDDRSATARVRQRLLAAGALQNRSDVAENNLLVSAFALDFVVFTGHNGTPHALNSSFLVVLLPIMRSCFFLQTLHWRMTFCLFPCFLTVFSPALLLPWPVRLRACARLPSAIVRGLPLLTALAL